jgi:prepilin-type N-terminal cleavage/methylation domain-containing protein
MRGIIKRKLSNQVRNQEGFTLVEMLVVIGIIVALAAVVVPLVIQFSGDGAEAAENAEWDAVQTSIDTLMADNELTAVSASTASTRISDTLDWDAGTGTQTMANYTRDANTNFCYQWATTGRLTAQFKLNADNSCSSTQTNP